MSRGINKVILVGNLGQDPEVRSMPNGDCVANVSLATADGYRDKNTGQMVDRTEWHRLVFFGKVAEIVRDYCKKGSQIYVEGKLQTRKWTDQQGQDRYTTEIKVDSYTGQMQLLGSRGDSMGGNTGGYQTQPQQAPQHVQQQPVQQAAQQPMQQPYQPAPQASAPAGYQPQPTQPMHQTAPAQSAPQQAAAPQPSNAYDDFDDDIPF